MSSASSVVNAGKFGFLPGNDATENSLALQQCLDKGGNIKVTKPGVYDICRTFTIHSNTSITFSPGVILRKTYDSNQVAGRYVFINDGAFSHSTDSNIVIKGLTLQVNGIDNGTDIENIIGLRGHLSFFHIKNLNIDRLNISDLERKNYGVQACSFEKISVTNFYLEGYKDGIHLGTGQDFVIAHGKIRTYDDPIALNAQDYVGSTPELGWISNGLIEDITDLEDTVRGNIGFFCRILSGSWNEWKKDHGYQSQGDAVISNGRIYRTYGSLANKSYHSKYRPNHEKGIMTYPDSLTWYMAQDHNIGNDAGVKNITFKNIHLQKKRAEAISVHMDRNPYSRSYYPNSSLPTQDLITLDQIQVEAQVDCVLAVKSPANRISVINSQLGTSKIKFKVLDTPGVGYRTTQLTLINNTTDSGAGNPKVITNGRPVKILTE